MDTPEQRIISDLAILGGKPHIKGTRISVDHVVEMVTNGATIEKMLEAVPHVTRDDLDAALAFAGCKAREPEVIVEQRRSSYSRR